VSTFRSHIRSRARDDVDRDDTLDAAHEIARIVRHGVVRPIKHVFLMTGAEANTGWLNGRVSLDAKCSIKTEPT
jgi:hypothetical protein